MLEFFRTRIKDSIIFKAFLGMLALSFGIWGVGDFVGGSSLAPGVALKAGDAEVRVDTVQRYFTRELEQFRQAMGGQVSVLSDPATRNTVMTTLLQDLTRQATIRAATNNLGVTVTREELRDQIMRTPTFQRDGKFSEALFQEILSQNQMTEANAAALYDGEVREGILVQPAAQNASAPQTLVDALFKYRGETRVADTLLVPASAMDLKKTPTEEELKAVYDKNIAAFTAPEYRKLSVLTLTSGDLVKTESIDDAAVKAYYDENQGRYKTAETRHLVQLVFKSKEEADAARAKAAPGDSLETVAAKAKAGAVVDLGEVNAAAPLMKMLDGAFATPLHEISQPIQSPLGWHLIEVKSSTPEAVQTLEATKETIRKAIAQEKGIDAVYDASTHLEDGLASGAPLADVAKTVGARIVEIPAIDKDGKDPAGLTVPNLVDPTNLLNTAFDTGAGKESKMLDLPTKDGYYVVHVDTVTPPAPHPLDEVRPKVVTLWQAQERTALAQATADKIAKDLGPSSSLAAVETQDKRISYAPLGPITRSGTGLERQHVIDSKRISPDLLSRLFTAKVGDVVVAPVEDGILVARLKDITVPTPTGALAPVREQMSQALKAQIGTTLSEELIRAYTARFPVTVDQKIIGDITNQRQSQ